MAGQCNFRGSDSRLYITIFVSIILRFPEISKILIKIYDYDKMWTIFC